MGEVVSPFRAVLLIVIVAQVALIAVFQRVRINELRYAQAERQSEIRHLTLENRTLLLQVSESLRPESLASRARAMGLDMHPLDASALVHLTVPKKTPINMAQRPGGRRAR